MSLSASVRLTLGRLRIDAELREDTDRLVVLLGPNGAGKTTLLRALAGLVPLESGRVELDGVVLEDAAAGIRLSPERRAVGVVFQDYLLVPHLTVLENIAFGLRARGVGREPARERARRLLRGMGLEEHERSKPRMLSGGQSQRVALARALAIEPGLLLLDEPLAALDAGARAEIRRELKRHLASFSGTRVLVTHDPLEAMTLGDKLVVLERGRVVQEGSPAELRARPRSRYVAQLVGLNLLRGVGRGDRIELAEGGELRAAGAGTGEMFAAFHPRAVALYRSRPDGTPRNVWRATVRTLDHEGDRVRVRLDGRPPVVAEVTPAAVSDLGLADGGEVWASVKATEIEVYPA
ncbi:MAG: ABC transporter ATP-binding protein [Actinomycetota bacterium]